MHEGTPIFACFLDASKAFDLVKHSALSRRLLDKSFPVYLIPFLLSWCKEQCMCVQYGNKLSDSFSVTNMVLNKVGYFPLFCSHFISIISLRIRIVKVLSVTGTAYFLVPSALLMTL